MNMMTSVGCKPAIPAIHLLQNCAFDLTAIGIGKPLIFTPPNSLFCNFSCFNENMDEYSKFVKGSARVLTS
jgi:hypothetical protein